jgi:hypothetical protein
VDSDVNDKLLIRYSVLSDTKRKDGSTRGQYISYL